MRNKVKVISKEGEKFEMHKKDGKEPDLKKTGNQPENPEGDGTKTKGDDAGTKENTTGGNAEGAAKNSGNQAEAIEKEIADLGAKLDEKTRKCDETFQQLQRMAAEFDNYRKRTAKEKEALYAEAVGDVIGAFLPVIDNLDRAMKAAAGKTADQSIMEGLSLVGKQVNDVLKKLEVEEIKAVGQEFNPDLHNAVMHMDDEALGKNTVVEEFQKGYVYKEKVIRHSMVKVAN